MGLSRTVLDTLNREIAAVSEARKKQDEIVWLLEDYGYSVGRLLGRNVAALVNGDVVATFSTLGYVREWLAAQCVPNGTLGHDGSGSKGAS